MQAVAIVLVVMLLSLGLRTGLVVATLVPVTMIIAMWAMSIFDIQIDQMSLAALIIALGLLVDNAIVSFRVDHGAHGRRCGRHCCRAWSHQRAQGAVAHRVTDHIGGVLADPARGIGCG